MRSSFSRRSLFALPLAALLALVPSCASPTAPEGFTLVLQFANVRVSAIEALRLTFSPVVENMQTPHFVAPMRGTSFENGDIQISVDSVTGLLTMVISPEYVAANATTEAGELSPRLEIELWTDDTMAHMGPQVRATAQRGNTQIATGVDYLPTWPPVLGGTRTIDVPCMPGLEAMCDGR